VTEQLAALFDEEGPQASMQKRPKRATVH